MTEQQTKHPRCLGILGGLGPMASVYFYELITAHTEAECDQEHLDLVLSSRATTPDRTAYIVGESEDSPLPAMIEEAKKLCAYGAELLVMPCNTAHYFYDSIRCAIDLPMLNIVDETLSLCARLGKKKVGLLATDGTVEARTYQRRCAKYGLSCCIPDAEGQKAVMHLIYENIKKGIDPDPVLFARAVRSLLAQSCDAIILGCTELSLISRTIPTDPCLFVDSMEALADAAIRACGKNSVGFSFSSI